MMNYLKQMESIRASGHPCDSQPTVWVNREELLRCESVYHLRGSADSIY